MSDPINAIQYHEGHVDHNHDMLHSRVDVLEQHPAECEARHAELIAENIALREALEAHLAEHESNESDESDTTETTAEATEETEIEHETENVETPAETTIAETRVELDKIPQRNHVYFRRLIPERKGA